MALWKIINKEDAVLIPKNWGENFPEDFCTSNFLGRVEPLCRHSIGCSLSPDHSDITSFRPWSPIATRNHLALAEEIPKLARTTGTVDVFDPRSGISGPTSRRASACPNLHE